MRAISEFTVLPPSPRMSSSSRKQAARPVAANLLPLLAFWYLDAAAQSDITARVASQIVDGAVGVSGEAPNDDAACAEAGVKAAGLSAKRKAAS
jgi:hypothetical protein